VNFRTEKIESKYKNLKRLAILLVVLGVISLIISYSGSSRESFRIWNYWDGFFFLFLGVVGYFSMSKRLNVVQGSCISFNQDSVDFKSRNSASSNLPYSEIDDVIIKLKTIEIVTEKGHFILHLEDYLDYKEKISIKSRWKEIREKLSTTSPK
jgi:TctA family transporter